MKKIALLIPLAAVMSAATVYAETIYTNSAYEYAKALRDINSCASMTVQSDESELEYLSSLTLMVKYDGELDGRGAQYDIYDEYDIHTLRYKSSEAADTAYEYYLENGYIVCRDELMSVQEDTEKSYLSWGSEFIGTDCFIKTLNTQYENSVMPETRVAVIDSGIDYNHPFLKDCVDVESGCDLYNGNDDPMDDNRHGTHVAGIIADNTPNNVTLIPIKITDGAGNTDTAFFKAGIKKAIELDVDVINLSIASPSEWSDTQIANYKEEYSEIFEEAEEKGIVICIAAGNGAKNADKVFPGFMDKCINVANSKQDGSINTGSSNYGSCIDIAAPGTNIYSTFPISKQDGYGTLTGTSMSTPFVSAAAAMIKQRYKDISPLDIENIIKGYVTPYTSDNDKYYGCGIIKMHTPAMVVGYENGIPVYFKTYNDRELIQEPEQEYEKIRVFFWDSLNRMSVLKKAEEYQRDEQ